MGLLLGLCYGSYGESAKVYRIFLEQNKYTMFQHPREAQRALQDRIVLAMIQVAYSVDTALCVVQWCAGRLEGGLEDGSPRLHLHGRVSESDCGAAVHQPAGLRTGRRRDGRGVQAAHGAAWDGGGRPGGLPTRPPVRKASNGNLKLERLGSSVVVQLLTVKYRFL